MSEQDVRGNVAALRAFVARGGVDLRAEVWPLMAKEIAWGWYHELLHGHPDRVRLDADAFEVALLDAVTGLSGSAQQLRTHRHEAVELVLDLLDHHRRAARDDGDAAAMAFGVGLGDRQAFDVVAAAREQADHAR